MVDEGDRLYGLSLEDFTKARDSLAARLRSAGDAEEAAQVKALRKPTTPAWAVNQLARRQRPLVEELIGASDRLRRAQQELLAGGSAQNVWEATLAERDILGRLIHEAERILEGQRYGANRGTLDRISDTLAAAAADTNGRTLLRRGILTNEMRRAGFGDLLGDVPGPPKARVTGSKRTPAKPKPAAKPARAVARPSGKAFLDAEREAARLARAAARAEEDAERMERAATRAEEGADSARKRAAVAEKEAARARAEASASRKDARAARREADRAASRLDKLR